MLVDKIPCQIGVVFVFKTCRVNCLSTHTHTHIYIQSPGISTVYMAVSVGQVP